MVIVIIVHECVLKEKDCCVLEPLDRVEAMCRSGMYGFSTTNRLFCNWSSLFEHVSPCAGRAKTSGIGDCGCWDFGKKSEFFPLGTFSF